MPPVSLEGVSANLFGFAIGKLVRDFTGDRLGQDMHNTIFIVGNDKTGTWADPSGYASATDLREQVDTVSTLRLRRPM